jgi:hypothetical protein
MNTSWLKMPAEKRIAILNQATELTGLPGSAIEKDWWVTLCLEGIFSLPFSRDIIFKGGTSLSKGWQLIERFSEDIDLAIDRQYFGFEEDISKTQIKKLRKISCEFISTEFQNGLTETLSEWGAGSDCDLHSPSALDSDKDPQTIEIYYQSVFESSQYLPQRVLIEIGSRSLMEPVEKREITSIVSDCFPQSNYATAPFLISTVLPQRTFLEKIFLLHEEFSQSLEKIRIARLTRHLYDLEKLMDTEHGIAAIQDSVLINRIIQHRTKFNPLRGLDYNKHKPEYIKLIPPNEILKAYEKDYNEMRKFMIYGESMTFDTLLKRISVLQERIHQIKW